jgi:transposase
MTNIDKHRAKRTQCDYTLGFKLAIVEQVEKGDFTYKQAQIHYGIQGKTTVLVWLRKHGKLDWSKPISMPNMPKSKETPAQKIKRLEKEVADLKLKNDVMEGMVDIMDNEYGAGIRKKYYASTSGEKKKQEE